MFKKVIVPFRPYYLGTFFGNSFPSLIMLQLTCKMRKHRMLNGLVNLKMTILSLYNPHVVSNPLDFIFTEQKRREILINLLVILVTH